MFRLKLLLGALLAGSLLLALMLFVLRSALRSTLLEGLTSSMAAAAGGIAVGLDPSLIDPVALAGREQADPAAVARLRETLIRVRTLVARELPTDWAQGQDSAKVPDLMVVLQSRDGNGWVAASTDSEFEGVSVNTADLIASAGTGPGPERTPADVMWEHLGNDSRARVLNGREVIGGWAPLRDADRHARGLLLVQADSRLFAASSRALDIASVVVITMFVGAMLALALLLAWVTARPIEKLAGGMNKVGQGDLTVELEPGSRFDGFDALVARFNQMVAGLRERAQMRRELADASVVQQQLLPRCAPEIAGYEATHSVDYCDETGGDYIDFIPLADDQRNSEPSTPWSVAVGDISGHGIAAAMLMSWTRSLLWSQAPDYTRDPSALLQLINRHFFRDANEGKFLTLFYAVLDPGSHTLAWTSAGHDPGVVVRRSEKEPLRLDSRDVPIGVLSDSVFPQGMRISFEPGDVLFVGTDGVSQCRNRAGEWFGLERIEGILRAMADEPLDKIRDAINEAVKRHRGNCAQDDDVTFVLVRRRAAVLG